jgi:DNA-binding MarR family transcriptional regulator
MSAIISSTDGATRSDLSPGNYKILGLLRKGCAYSVRGVWRFRGVRGSVRDQALRSLLAWGLAERVQGDRCEQVRITAAGRSINVDGR